MAFTREELIEALGDGYTTQVVQRLRRLAHIPAELLAQLGRSVLTENWGNKNYVLEKYLAVHLSWCVEQDCYTQNESQMYFTAGHLQTRYGSPLYIAFERNKNIGLQPLYAVYVGTDVSAARVPTPPEIPKAPELPMGAEIILMHEHILESNSDRVPFLNKTPPVSQMCAVSGAIQWSLNRSLQIPYWYFGQMGLLVPLYMQTRDNITLGPDLIAPVQINAKSLLVRTLLLPHMPYANARVSVVRHDLLPPWMLDAWNNKAAEMSDDQIENPEGRQ